MANLGRVALAMCVLGWAGRCDERVVRAFGVSLSYDSQDFAAQEVKREPKLTAQENGTDIPVDVAPARTSVRLDRDRGVIEVIPLRDPSVKSFAQAYPQVAAAAEAVRSALTAKVSRTQNAWRQPTGTRSTRRTASTHA